MKRIINLIFTLMMLNLSHSSAQTPSLEIAGDKKQNKVYLKDLDIKVDVVGNISTTTMTMVFQNKTTQILEGTLTFPLPDGVTISAYALDINGKMRQAVPVDKAKGTQVFEEIERRRVDPGLLEKVEGNNFRTRIYPIPANGNRTISVSYEEALLVSNNKYTYRLPMNYKQAIDKFGLTLRVWKDAKPIVEAGKNEISFDKQNNVYISQFSRTNYIADQLLAFSIPTLNTADIIMQSASGSYYFTINHFLKNKQKRKKLWSDNLGIIWDASLSTNAKDVEKEMIILDAIIKDKKNLTIKVGLLNNTFKNAGTFTIENANWNELKELLTNITYDGGTNYSAIDLNKIQSDEYILFSDGISTLSESNINNKRKAPIHCIVSSASADYSNLKSIALNTKAKFVNLNALDIEKAKEEIFDESYQFLGIKENNNISQVYPSIPTNTNEHFNFAGISTIGETKITLQFGYGNTVTEEETITLDAKKHQNNEVNVHKIWAQKKIAEMDLNYDKNKKEITELSQQFGIVTRNTSLIVLELLSDYIQYNITPPQELKAEYNNYMQQLDSRREQQREQHVAQQISMLERAKSDMFELRKWWNTEFKINEPKYPNPDNKNGIIPLSAPILDESASMVTKDVKSTEKAVSDELSEVLMETSAGNALSAKVAGVSVKPQKKELNTYTPQKAKLTMIDIKNDADYMKRLTGNTATDYNIYIEERKNYGGTPSFYFNMADWFMKHKDREKAILILTSIAEVGLENVSAYKILSFRLKEYNEPELLLFTTKKLKEWRPFEQQSHRDYALALKENGKHQEALDSLYATIINPVSNSFQMATLGMNMIILSEINNLIAKNKENISAKAIDTALTHSMPVDVRVLINWSVPQTHIDMQITDPRGEIVTYNHNRSQIGGRLDAHEIMDFGPEQFLLKKGIKGKYTIQVDYWGDSNVSPNTEPATIMAEIFIGYSSGKEERKIVCFNLSNANIDKAQKKITIAEFEI